MKKAVGERYCHLENKYTKLKLYILYTNLFINLYISPGNLVQITLK